jgi:soluble lytic murein transglycosylase
VSPPTATVTNRREAARRAAARRRTAARRRALLWVVGIGGLIVAVVIALPDVRKAVNDLTLPLQYQDVIRLQAADKHLDPAFVAAVIYAETKFDPQTSGAGAEGLMQILPQTAEFLAHRSGATSFTTADLATPQVNIAYGSYYLRYLLDKYGGSKILALAAYNGGETNVNRWVAAAHGGGRQFAISDIVFPETRAYVEKVLQAQRSYRKTYPTELGYR